MSPLWIAGRISGRVSGRPRLVAAAALALVSLAGLASAQHNVLVIVADDLGVDKLASYGVGSNPPSTPNLDALAAGGIQFRNAFANPVCSPTRTTILTGRYGFRTGVGQILSDGSDGPWHTEYSIPEVINLSTLGLVSLGRFGKWHMGGPNNGGPFSPNFFSYDFFEGTYIGLDPLFTYYVWDELKNGVVTPKATYNTSEVVDDVLKWLSEPPQQVNPWYAHVSFNAPHSPYHAPPAELHSVNLDGAGSPNANPLPYYNAMVEAMDTEIGRLLAGLGPALANTNIIFVGDNGTPGEAMEPPFDHAKDKGTLFDGGIHVPLIVSGPAVQHRGAECDALVNTTDLWSTVIQLAGAKIHDVVPLTWVHDSVSILPYLEDPTRPSIRQWVYSEFFGPNGQGVPFESKSIGVAVFDGRYKLIRTFFQGTHIKDRMFDLKNDPFERRDLVLTSMKSPAVVQAYRDLVALQESLKDGGFPGAQLTDTEPLSPGVKYKQAPGVAASAR